MKAAMQNTLSEKKRMLIFINVMISGISTSMLSTAMTTALPPVAAYFGVGVATGQWMTSGYSLAMGIIMPLTAYLVKKIPTKKLYISGIVCFIIGELLSILAGNFAWMMAGRILQACGNGVLLAMAQVIILSVYPPDRKGTMMGWYGLATTGAPILAPTIAGVLVDTVGWKYIFVFTMVIMIGSLAMSIANFENVLKLQNVNFDIISFVESLFAFGGITLGIGTIGDAGILSITAGLPLGIGAVGMILFVYRQLHLKEPFLDMRILKCREYAISVIGSILLYLVMMGGSVLMPLYVQSVMGGSALMSALVTLPGSVATALVSPFAGRIYDKMGIKKLFVTGSITLLASNISMYFISMDTPLWTAAAFNVLRNISIGCLLMPLLTWGTSFTEKSKVADASSLLTSLRTVSGSIGSATFVSIMTITTAASITDYGDAAPMHGLNTAFLSMGICSLAMTLVAIFLVRGRKKL